MGARSTHGRQKPGPLPRHGGYSLLTRGTLPEKRRYIGHHLTAVREGLINDIAGSEQNLTTAQGVLIDRVVTFLGVVRLIEEHARDHGLLDPRGRLKGGIGTANYLSFNRHIKECLALLGLDRRKVDDALDVTGYIQARDAAREAGEGEIARPAANAGHFPGNPDVGSEEK
jgi:hypothetical protein